MNPVTDAEDRVDFAIPVYDDQDGRWGRPRDPTLAEIALQTAQIRATWSELTHRERAGLALRPRWRPPHAGSAVGGPAMAADE